MAGYFSIPVIADRFRGCLGGAEKDDLIWEPTALPGEDRLSGVERGRSCRLNEHPLALFILMVAADRAVGVPSGVTQHREYNNQPDEEVRKETNRPSTMAPQAIMTPEVVPDHGHAGAERRHGVGAFLEQHRHGEDTDREGKGGEERAHRAAQPAGGPSR